MEEILVISMCLALNALLAAYEMAFVSVPQSALKQASESGSRSAKRLLRLRASPERTLSIIQIGISLVGAVSAAVGGAGAIEDLAPYFETTYGISSRSAQAVSIALIVVPLTYLSVVIGELVPKSIALRHPLKITLMGSRWLFIADRAFSPLVTLLEWSTKTIMAILFPKNLSKSLSQKISKKLKRKKTAAGSPNDLEGNPGQENAAGESIQVENLPSHHRQAILNLAHLERRTLQDIVHPWTQVVTIQNRSSLEEVVPLIFASGHTRIPVVEDKRVVGILHTKEFLALREVGAEDWRAAIRPALYMRPNDLILTTLRIMQEKRSHLAVIVSGANEPLGIVTMEDISEQIWGDIYDEDDDSRVQKIFADRVKRKAFHERRT